MSGVIVTNAAMLERYFNTQQGGEFGISAMTYSKSENISPVAGCYGWMAINKCNGTVFVNKIPLLGFIAPGLSGEVWGYVDNYRLYNGFIKLDVPVGLTTTVVVIVQIFKIAK